MSKKELELGQKLQLQQVMTDFCLPFSEKLLNKLKQLNTEDRIFVEGGSVARKSVYAEITPITEAVMNQLHYQIFKETGLQPSSIQPEELDVLISTAEEFIEIFK